MRTFKEDLANAQKTEIELAELLKSRNPKASVALNESTELAKLREYDLLFEKESKQYKIELKNDLLAPKTGNVAIEHKCVKHSKSDYFCYKIEDDFYMIKLKRIKKLCNQFRFNTVNGGDGGRSFLYLIPFRIFAKTATKLT